MNLTIDSNLTHIFEKAELERSPGGLDCKMVVAATQKQSRTGGWPPSYSRNSPSNGLDVIPKGTVSNAIFNFSSPKTTSVVSPPPRKLHSSRPIPTRGVEKDKLVQKDASRLEGKIPIVTPSDSTRKEKTKSTFCATPPRSQTNTQNDNIKLAPSPSSDTKLETDVLTAAVTPTHYDSALVKPTDPKINDIQTLSDAEQLQNNDNTNKSPDDVDDNDGEASRDSKQVQCIRDAANVSGARNTDSQSAGARLTVQHTNNVQAATAVNDATSEKGGGSIQMQHKQSDVNTISHLGNDAQSSIPPTRVQNKQNLVGGPADPVQHGTNESHTETVENQTARPQLSEKAASSGTQPTSSCITPLSHREMPQEGLSGDSANMEEKTGPLISAAMSCQQNRDAIATPREIAPTITPNQTQQTNNGLGSTTDQTKLAQAPPNQQRKESPQAPPLIETPPTRLRAHYQQHCRFVTEADLDEANVVSGDPHVESFGSLTDISPLSRTPNTPSQYTDPSIDFGSDVYFVDDEQKGENAYDSPSFREFEEKIVKSMKDNFKEDKDTDVDSMTSQNEDESSYGETSRCTDASSFYSRYDLFDNSSSFDFLFDDNSLVASDESSFRRPRRKNKRYSPKKKALPPIKGKLGNKKAPTTVARRSLINKKKTSRRDESSSVSVMTEDCWDRLEYTVDDLAFELAKQNRQEQNRSTIILSPMRSRIVERFKQKLPDLYGQVQGKINENTGTVVKVGSLEAANSQGKSSNGAETVSGVANQEQSSCQHTNSRDKEKNDSQSQTPLKHKGNRKSSNRHNKTVDTLGDNGAFGYVAPAKDEASNGRNNVHTAMLGRQEYPPNEEMDGRFEISENFHESDLDLMIEEFLASKLDMLSSKIRLKNESAAGRDKIMSQDKLLREVSDETPVPTQSGESQTTKPETFREIEKSSQRKFSPSVLEAAEPPRVTKLKPPKHVGCEKTPSVAGSVSQFFSSQSVASELWSSVSSQMAAAMDAVVVHSSNGRTDVAGHKVSCHLRANPEPRSQTSRQSKLCASPTMPGFHVESSDRWGKSHSGISLQRSNSMLSYPSISTLQDSLISQHESCVMSAGQDTWQASFGIDAASLLVNRSLPSQHSSETGWDNEERTLNEFLVEKGRSVVCKIRSKRQSRATSDSHKHSVGTLSENMREDISVASPDMTAFQSEAGTSAAVASRSLEHPGDAVSYRSGHDSGNVEREVAYIRDSSLSPFVHQSDNGVDMTSTIDGPHRDGPSTSNFYIWRESSSPSQGGDIARFANPMSDSSVNRSDSATNISDDFIRDGRLDSAVTAYSVANRSEPHYSEAEGRAVLDEYMRQRTEILNLISRTTLEDVPYPASTKFESDDQTDMSNSTMACQSSAMSIDESSGYSDFGGSIESDLANFLTGGTRLEIETKRKKKNKRRPRASSRYHHADSRDDHLETLHESINESDGSPHGKNTDQIANSNDTCIVPIQEPGQWAKSFEETHHDLFRSGTSPSMRRASTMLMATPPSVARGSFGDAELSTCDLLTTLSPPSPESPIRDYMYYDSVAPSDTATAGDASWSSKGNNMFSQGQHDKNLVMFTTEAAKSSILPSFASTEGSGEEYLPEQAGYYPVEIQRRLADSFSAVRSIDYSDVVPKQRRISPHSVKEFGDIRRYHQEHQNQYYEHRKMSPTELNSIGDDQNSNDLFFVDDEDEEYAANPSFIGDNDTLESRFFEI